MPLNPTSFVPDIIQNILKGIAKEIGNPASGNILKNEKISKNLLIELDAIFGKELAAGALRLLDEELFTRYCLESNVRSIIEIRGIRNNSSKSIKLLPDVNYCSCDFFRDHVLNIGNSAQKDLFYTCPHVLAIQLATLLNLPVLREEIVSKLTFNCLQRKKYRMQHSKILYEKGILKNLKMLTQSQYTSFKFVARLDHMKSFYTGIKALNFGESGAFQISEDGFRITVENGKCVQANLYITTSCFSEYHVDGIVNFSLNMNTISECLGIYSGLDSSMKMFYKGEGSPLIVIMEPHDEDDITTECSIKTTHHEEPIEFNLDEESSSFNMIFIRGPDLANLFHELDKTAEELEITLSPRKPHFKIDTLGVMQSESSIEVARTSDMMTLFNCRDITKSRYNNSHIRLIMKALSLATKVAMKTNASGLLEMHFMIQSDPQAEVYIQFFIVPVTDLDD